MYSPILKVLVLSTFALLTLSCRNPSAGCTRLSMPGTVQIKAIRPSRACPQLAEVDFDFYERGSGLPDTNLANQNCLSCRTLITSKQLIQSAGANVGTRLDATREDPMSCANPVSTYQIERLNEVKTCQ